MPFTGSLWHKDKWLHAQEGPIRGGVATPRTSSRYRVENTGLALTFKVIEVTVQFLLAAGGIHIRTNLYVNIVVGPI